MATVEQQRYLSENPLATNPENGVGQNDSQDMGEALDALLYLVNEISPPDEPAPSVNILGAVDAIVMSGRHSMPEAFGSASERAKIFLALDELEGKGLLSFTFDGFLLSDHGRERLREVGEHFADLSETASLWRAA